MILFWLLFLASCRLFYVPHPIYKQLLLALSSKCPESTHLWSLYLQVITTPIWITARSLCFQSGLWSSTFHRTVILSKCKLDHVNSPPPSRPQPNHTSNKMLSSYHGLLDPAWPVSRLPGFPLLPVIQPHWPLCSCWTRKHALCSRSLFLQSPLLGRCFPQMCKVCTFILSRSPLQYQLLRNALSDRPIPGRFNPPVTLHSESIVSFLQSTYGYLKLYYWLIGWLVNYFVTPICLTAPEYELIWIKDFSSLPYFPPLSSSSSHSSFLPFLTVLYLGSATSA